MIIIGDIHEKVNSYFKILQKHPGSSIAAGDLGNKKAHEWHLKNIDSPPHYVLFGNHDDYTYLREKHSLGNYYYFEKEKLMTVRGAHSKYTKWQNPFTKELEERTPGISIWPDQEELSAFEMNAAMNMYNLVQPDVMVTHDAPHEAVNLFFKYYEKPSRTQAGLQAMFSQHQPSLWIFGHHHTSRKMKINGTTFVCLSELEVYNL